MNQAPLVTKEINAGAELFRQLEKSFPLQAAFWAKDSDGGPWYLHIASDQFRAGDQGAGYQEVLRLAWEMASPHLDAMQVKLIPTSHPMAQAAMEINRRFPARVPTRFGDRSFGGVSVEGVYVYPPSVAATTPWPRPDQRPSALPLRAAACRAGCPVRPNEEQATPWVKKGSNLERPAGLNQVDVSFGLSRVVKRTIRVLSGFVS